MFLRILSVALAGVLLLAACGGDGDSDSAGDDAESDDTESEDAESDDSESADTADDPEPDDEAADSGSDPAAEKPTVEVPEGPPPTELVIVDIVVGDGPEATASDRVTAHYVGVLHEDGTEFDSSWDRGQPFAFQLGTGGVIPGWDQGIEGMKVGGRRMLVIPSDLAYGEAGSPPTIGPDAALVFVVDLLEVLSIPDEAPTLEIPEEFSGELEIIDLVEGDGRAIKSGDAAILHYILALESSGQVEDSSWETEPVVAQIGDGIVIAGWDVGLIGMKEGGRRLLVVPPDLAFGEEGNGPVPPNDTLIFLIDLLQVN